MNDKWEPQTLEDKLIAKYAVKNKGTYYLEVPIGNNKKIWPKKSKIRRIDAINIKNSNLETSKIYGQKEFEFNQFQEMVLNNTWN